MAKSHGPLCQKTSCQQAALHRLALRHAGP
jgi:hypothetical protein